MRIIIAGEGKVGTTLARLLSAEGYDLTLIDSNPQVVEDMMAQFDAISVTGNCATIDTLKQAGVDKAGLLIAVASADEVNLLCCMTAHAINPKIHTIARIRNPEYSGQVYKMSSSFGLSLAVNPEKQAAHQIEKLLQFPGFLKRETFAKNRVEIVELRIDEDSKLNGVSLSVLDSIVKCRVLVCVVLRDGNVIMPGGHFILRKDDRIFVTAPTNVITTLLDNLGIITNPVRKVFLAGGGRVSYYLAQRLRKSGIAVQILEKDYDRCLNLSTLLPDVDIIHGDATSHAVLEREGLSECDALVSLTGLDEMNIVISLFAAGDGIKRVVTKLGHEENANILDKLPIGSVVCPKELCGNTIVRYVRAMQKQSGAAVSVHAIAQGQAEAVEFLVDEKTKHCGDPLKKMKLKKNVLLVSITHIGETEIPNGDSAFHVGDTVVVVTSAGTVLLQLNDIFE